MTTSLNNQIAIRTYADGFGQWRAEVTLDPPLSDTEERPEANLAAQWPAVTQAAREAIIEELVQRHQLNHETEAQARSRLTEYLHNVKLLETTGDELGRVCAVTFGE